MKIRPIPFKNACDFVAVNHRHHSPPQGHKFSIACYSDDGQLLGVAICGRPVARHLDDGLTLEVTRLCTDGTYNACSMLYGAAARIAKDMGYQKIITYILATESGTSLKASGWIHTVDSPGGSGRIKADREKNRRIRCRKRDSKSISID